MGHYIYIVVVFKDKPEFNNAQDCAFSPTLTNSPVEAVFSNSPLMLSPQMKSKQNQVKSFTNKLYSTS
jgi:hypothetical protein